MGERKDKLNSIISSVGFRAGGAGLSQTYQSATSGQEALRVVAKPQGTVSILTLLQTLELGIPHPLPPGLDLPTTLLSQADQTNLLSPSADCTLSKSINLVKG